MTTRVSFLFSAQGQWPRRLFVLTMIGAALLPGMGPVPAQTVRRGAGTLRPDTQIPQRPVLPPWIEALTAHATDPLDQQDWEPRFGGLPQLRNAFLGPSSGLLVSLATGEETFLPRPDVLLPNPQGTNAVFSRSYRSGLAQKGYGSPGLAPGWIHNLDLVIVAPGSGWGPVRLVYPNGSTDLLVPTLNGTGRPTGVLTSPSGMAAQITGVPGQSVGDWRSLSITWQDGSQWTFEPDSAAVPNGLSSGSFRRFPLTGAEKILLPTRLQELALRWDEKRRIRGIDTQAEGVRRSLLTFDYDVSTGRLSHITDRAQRRIDFGFTKAPSIGKKLDIGAPPVLSGLSQVYLVGTAPKLPHRVEYEYAAVPGVSAPLLTTVRVPHPGAAAGSLAAAVATIEYASGRVAAHIDANKIEHRYTYKPTGTQQDVRDTTGEVLSSVAYTIDAEGRLRAIKDAQGGTTSFTYGDNENSAQIRATALSVVTAPAKAPAKPAPAPRKSAAAPAADAPLAALSVTSGAYTYTKIAEMDTLEPFAQPAPVPPLKKTENVRLVSRDGLQMNNRGTVALKARIARGDGLQGTLDAILTGDGGPLQKVVVIDSSTALKPGSSSPFTQLHDDCSFGISDNDSIVFGAEHRIIQRGIFRARRGEPTVCLAGQYGDAPIKVAGFGRLLVNGPGDVCFSGTLMDAGYNKTPLGPVPNAPDWTPPAGMSLSGMFVLRKGKLSNIDDAIAPKAPDGSVAYGAGGFSDQGDVLVHWNTGMAYTDRLYVVGPSGTRLIASSEGPMGSLTPVGLLRDGTVLFDSRSRTDSVKIPPSYNIPRTALYRWRNGQIQKIMDDDVSRLTRNATLATPDGILIFSANLFKIENGSRSEQPGLFVGSNPEKDQILKRGDSLFGAKIEGITIFAPHINDKGQWAFAVSLDNKKTVIVRATPTKTTP